MSRVWADRIVRTLLTLIAAGVLWIVVYEIAVGARYIKERSHGRGVAVGVNPGAVRRSRFFDLRLENRAARTKPFLGANSNIRPPKRKP